MPQRFECNHCSGCMTDFATIGHSYVWGVSPSGPYHYEKTGGWMERIPNVCPSTYTIVCMSPAGITICDFSCTSYINEGTCQKS